MDRTSKTFLVAMFFTAISNPAYFVFSLIKADSITATIMVTTYFLNSAIFGIIFSWLSDKFLKRKIFTLCGFIILSIAFIGYYFSSSPFQLILCSSLVGIAYGLYSPTSTALFTEMEPNISKGKLMSYFHVIASCGWALGTIIGGVISDLYNDFVFIFLTFFTFIGLSIFYLKVQDIPPHKDSVQTLDEPKLESNLQIYPYLIAILSIVILTRYICAQGGLVALLPNYLSEPGQLNATQFITSLILSINMCFQALLMIPVGRLVDHKKFGRKIILLLGIFGTAFTILSYSFIRIPWIIIFPQMLIGFSWPAIITSSNAMVTDITTRRNRSRGMGWLNAGASIGGILGPIFAGLILAQSGNNYTLAFQLLSISPFIGIILFVFLVFENRATHEYFLIGKR